MTRLNPHIKVTVDGILNGTRTYHIKVILAVRELWGTNTAPEDLVVEGEELSPISSLGVEDGDYVLTYSFGSKDFKLNRKVTGGRLRAA
jgi:hypothetical protein